MPKGIKDVSGLTVNKTVSLPLPVIVKINDIMEYTKSDFSTVLLRILKIGFSVYGDCYKEATEAQKEVK